jgi:transcriptional regulator with XRE-family HTH domain
MYDRAKMRTLREKRGLTQEEAAKLADMSQQQWANIEGGHTGRTRGVSLPTLGKVAKALGVKAKDLLK